MTSRLNLSQVYEIAENNNKKLNQIVFCMESLEAKIIQIIDEFSEQIKEDGFIHERMISKIMQQEQSMIDGYFESKRTHSRKSFKECFGNTIKFVEAKTYNVADNAMDILTRCYINMNGLKEPYWPMLKKVVNARMNFLLDIQNIENN